MRKSSKAGRDRCEEVEGKHVLTVWQIRKCFNLRPAYCQEGLWRRSCRLAKSSGTWRKGRSLTKDWLTSNLF